LRLALNCCFVLQSEDVACCMRRCRRCNLHVKVMLAFVCAGLTRAKWAILGSAGTRASK
jgi:hypothetical protein